MELKEKRKIFLSSKDFKEFISLKRVVNANKFLLVKRSESSLADFKAWLKVTPLGKENFGYQCLIFSFSI